MKKTILLIALFLTTLTSCAGVEQNANSKGEFDWIIVQYALSGEPAYAWKRENSDSEFNGYMNPDSMSPPQFVWESDEGHLLLYYTNITVVTVKEKKFNNAAKLVGVEYEKITNGRYTP